ncbi:MAG: CPBP family intramembrane glutamic endopeptidase [Phycisphaerae bacterium]|nr:CPBP family intramembrane glutamic endopeptidase [Phycisphaerae bacterium]
MSRDEPIQAIGVQQHLRSVTIEPPAISRASALTALAIIIPAPTIGALVSFWIAPGTTGLIVYALCKAVLYLLPALWHRFRDQERWSLSPVKHGGWLIGLVSGLAIGAVILLTWRVLGDRAIDTHAFADILAKNGLSDVSRFLMAAAWLTIVNSALEEYSFRWFITTRIEALAPRAATILSAAAFTLHHIVVLAAYLPYAMVIVGSAGIFVGGILWSWLYRRCRSIWPGWLSHALVDAAVMLVGYSVLFGH